MARIAVGGLQHETNTFAPLKATYEEFARGSGWPGLQRGAAILSAFEGMNIPIAGALAVLRAGGHELVPLVWAAATPSAHVTEDAYERIVGMMLDDLKSQLPVDGVYLDLHGAMVTEHLDDGEGELLGRVRSLVGPDIPVVASLDLHTNMTAQMLEKADFLLAYRTYPHVDMAETGQRVARKLQSFIDTRGKVCKHSNSLDFLIPLSWQCTMMDPGAAIYRRLGELERETEIALSFTPGFPAEDFPGCLRSLATVGSPERPLRLSRSSRLK